MVNLLDPVPLAVIVLILTTIILVVVLVTGGKKETPDKVGKAELPPSPAVEKKQTIVRETPKVEEPEEVNVLDDAPAEKVVWEEVEGVKSVEVNEEDLDSDEVVGAPERETIDPTQEPVEETEDSSLEEFEHSESAVEVSEETDLATTENNAEMDQENTEELENSTHEEVGVQEEGEREGEREELQGEVEVEDENEEEQYDEFNEEDADVAEYDESEYNPDEHDYEHDHEDQQDHEERDSESQENTPHEQHHNKLTLDTSSSTSTSSPRSPTKRTPTRSNEGGLSPMNSSSYKFGSHYQHKKVGDSWVKNSNTAASAAAASPVTVSPVRHSQPRKVIPVSDQEQPLSRKQSTKISQYEEGLQAEKTKVSNKVLETRRRTIEDVVHRVLLDGELPSEVDPTALIVDPAAAAEVGAEVKTKKIVKEMKAKFGSPVVSNIGSNGRSVSVDEE